MTAGWRLEIYGSEAGSTAATIVFRELGEGGCLLAGWWGGTPSLCLSNLQPPLQKAALMSAPSQWP